MTRLVKCLYCAQDLILLWEEPTFSRCLGCGLRIRNPQPSAAELSAMYTDSWTDPLHSTTETGGLTPHLATEYVKLIISELGINDLSDQNIMDFGAGRGALADALIARGATAYGIEPFGQSYLQNRGIKAYAQLDDLPEDIRFDGIVSMDVVEHLQAPWTELAQLYQFLLPGGWILIATPNPVGMAAKLNRGRWREAEKPGHILFLPPATLELMMRKIGFQDVRRLRWRVRFSDRPLRRLIHLFLQMSGLDGHVRVLGRKPSAL